MKNYEVIGLMSGTSLDGLDIAHVRFYFDSEWHFETIHCEAIPYNTIWTKKLSVAMELSGFELKKLDLEYGGWLGSQVKSFMDKWSVSPDLIVSHGHTVFHQPQIGLTKQIGDGYLIYKNTGIKTIFDLRSLDVVLGGQGAPLVPIGDRLLFGNYDFCLNLGGFSNISFELNDERIAFDICPVNTVLNSLSRELGHNFDENGHIAKSGNLSPKLLKKLNNLEYYHSPPPKSLGIEWVNENVFPLFDNESKEDLLHTFCHHIADQIVNSCNINSTISSKPRLLVTGGGTKNGFLIDLLRVKSDKIMEIVVPNELIIDFKEAIIFAFLGLLKHLEQDNCLKSVTGADVNSSGGLVVG